ncbi:MAG: hypothetical protein FJW27_11115 [Acidimicrobiia bacterium]|nr:hypothetical protein [Acidimicrobiia bacterium]
MPLDEYNRKRDFAKSPEPRGQVRSRNTHERFFCVQKHLASHLHYDFRLEHNGVLLSWAVPKGPSLDPKTRRLAMRTEDHPLDYGEFEGVIPEGYGAGIVMLWDRGTWTPEVADVDAALRKGDLKLILNGYKLKGSWVLVRTGGRYRGAREGDGRSWLLIKHRDDWSGELDITTFAPRSVKSGGEFEDILAADTPAIWESHRPTQVGEAGALLADIIARAARRKAAARAAESIPGPPRSRAMKATEKAATQSRALRARTAGDPTSRTSARRGRAMKSSRRKTP